MEFSAIKDVFETVYVISTQYFDEDEDLVQTEPRTIPFRIQGDELTNPRFLPITNLDLKNFVVRKNHAYLIDPQLNKPKIINTFITAFSL